MENRTSAECETSNRSSSSSSSSYTRTHQIINKIFRLYFIFFCFSAKMYEKVWSAHIQYRAHTWLADIYIYIYIRGQCRSEKESSDKMVMNECEGNSNSRIDMAILFSFCLCFRFSCFPVFRFYLAHSSTWYVIKPCLLSLIDFFPFFLLIFTNKSVEQTQNSFIMVGKWNGMRKRGETMRNRERKRKEMRMCVRLMGAIEFQNKGTISGNASKLKCRKENEKRNEIYKAPTRII